VSVLSLSLTSHPFIIRKKLSIEKASFHKRMNFSLSTAQKISFCFFS